MKIIVIIIIIKENCVKQIGRCTVGGLFGCRSGLKRVIDGEILKGSEPKLNVKYQINPCKYREIEFHCFFTGRELSEYWMEWFLTWSRVLSLTSMSNTLLYLVCDFHLTKSFIKASIWYFVILFKNYRNSYFKIVNDCPTAYFNFLNTIITSLKNLIKKKTIKWKWNCNLKLEVKLGGCRLILAKLIELHVGVRILCC